MKTRLEKLVIPGQAIPEMRFKGSAFDAGKYMAQWTLENYPFYPRILSMAVHDWSDPQEKVVAAFKKYAPWVLELYRGMLEKLHDLNFDADAPMPEIPVRNVDENSGCTSFSLAPELCVNHAPLAGQTKDTGIESLDLYIILNMHLTDGPSMLKLAYPGELCGYGFHNNNMSVFRNDLKSVQGGNGSLPGLIYCLLALSANSVDAAKNIALEYGLSGAGNYLISDSKTALAVESNAGGIGLVEPVNGILVHANHPDSPVTLPYEFTADRPRPEQSRCRKKMLYEAIANHKGLISVDDMFNYMALHAKPGELQGVCRHGNTAGTVPCTTAAVAADVLNKRFYAVKGPACMNKYSVYEML